MLFRRSLPITAALFGLAVAAGVAGQSASVVDDGYDGAIATGLALRRLGTTARVLHIGAHPDDENTALFAPLALGRGVDAAYLSLTRGEGGQNGIGPELGVALGLIRSEELLAARRLDGGEQFFTRAIDYGYSKNAGEAFEHWPRDTVLADVVAIIRRFRPDVVASVWSGTPRDGHGQHQAAGVVAREAVLAAGDPDRFPEQIAEGLRPHQPVLYYRSAWFTEGQHDVELNTGELDPLLGASYHQIAMASRSRHRSQDQGRPQDPGPRRTGFDLVEDPSAPPPVAASRGFGRYGEGEALETPSIFAGVDTLLSQRAERASGRADSGSGYRRAAGLFREYEELVTRSRARYNPLRPWETLPVLLEARERLADARDALDDQTGADAGLAADLQFHVADELDDLNDAILRVANVRLDVVADQATVVPGQMFGLELSVWNGGREPITVEARPSLPVEWAARPVRGSEPTFVVEPGELRAARYEVRVPADARLTMPYYLDPESPDPGDLYRWPDDPEVRGQPFAPAPVQGSFAVSVPGLPSPVPGRLEASHVGVDRRTGQFREPVKVVPAVSVALEPAVAVVRVSEPEPFVVTVRLRSRAAAGSTGQLRLALPDDWRSVPETAPVRFTDGEEQTITFQVHPPVETAAGQYELEAHVEVGGSVYSLGYDVVDYDHIAPHNLYHPARVRARVMDVEVAAVRVGYVPGAGDGVPGAMDQLGLEWETLDAADLAAGAFDRFDVIVTEVRAYEVNDDLVAHNQQLLDWVRRGGTLIVQYNKYEALSRDYTPWPVTIDRPHGRVTDETAPVRVLEPDHPVFHAPNRIGSRDWEGWVQERGLYFWETWDSSLTPLLAMSDPGEDELLGSLLVGPLGHGTYVYTGLALFRQLPEGVPGAYRLFANLLSLGAR